MGRSGNSSLAYLVMQNRDLEYGQPRLGFDTKHQSAKAPKHQRTKAPKHQSTNAPKHQSANLGSINCCLRSRPTRYRGGSHRLTGPRGCNGFLNFGYIVKRLSHWILKASEVWARSTLLPAATTSRIIPRYPGISAWDMGVRS